MTVFDTVMVTVLVLMSPETSIPFAEVSPVWEFTALTAPGSPVAEIATSHAQSSWMTAFAPSNMSVSPHM